MRREGGPLGSDWPPGWFIVCKAVCGVSRRFRDLGNCYSENLLRPVGECPGDRRDDRSARAPKEEVPWCLQISLLHLAPSSFQPCIPGARLRAKAQGHASTREGRRMQGHSVEFEILEFRTLYSRSDDFKKGLRSESSLEPSFIFDLRRKQRASPARLPQLPCRLAPSAYARSCRPTCRCGGSLWGLAMAPGVHSEADRRWKAHGGVDGVTPRTGLRGSCTWRGSLAR